jgi:gamma-glutamyltranspeptidase/glutathione hydrolase
LVPRGDDVKSSSLWALSFARRNVVSTGIGALAAISSLVGTFPTAGAAPKTITGRHQAVATENDTASRAAMRILENGGNAVDAAITAALVAGVASPSSSGIGGGGFALVWTAATKSVSILDFRETAPSQLDGGAFEHRPMDPKDRGKLIGVPGEVAGLFELHREFGKKRWVELVAPATRVAADGYPVSEHLATVLGFFGTHLAVDDVLSTLFMPGGRARARGATVTNLPLSATLRKIGAEGPRALYEGPIAAEMESAAHAAGGTLSAADISAYTPRARDPIHVRWEGYDVYTMGPPSGGGLMLAETLGTLSASELRPLGARTAPYTHLLADALRGALEDRMRCVSDPDQQTVDIAGLLAPRRLAARRSRFTDMHTQTLPSFLAEEHGTHHLVVADRDGNIVSLTTTVNHPFGALVATRSSGILLNDELDDFTLTSSSHALGLAENPNRARPLARPVSSMTPTLVVHDGTPVLVLGGSGGMGIGPSVTQALLERLVFDEPPDQAVSLPRFSIPTEGSTISVEPGPLERLKGDLESRGESMSVQKFVATAVQMIAFDKGSKLPAADPRKQGAALAE